MKLLGLNGSEGGAAAEGGGQLPSVADVRQRDVSAVVGGAYDGASQLDRDLISWQPPIRSADGDMLGEKLAADVRARDQGRNDAYVNGGVNVQKDSIVGAFYLLSAKPVVRVLDSKKCDEVWAEEFQEEVEAKFTTAVESPTNCWLDAGRKMTLTDMVRLAVGIDAFGGEILASVEWSKDPRRPFKTMLNFVDADRLSNPDGVSPTKNLRGGVHKDDFGAALGYHIRMGHPTDFWNDYQTFFWKYIPSRKPWGRLQMIHLFESWRPDQTRGIAAMVSALKEMRVTKKFRDITLQNAVVNATFAATIESELDASEVYAQLGERDFGKAVANIGDSYMNAIMRYAGASKRGYMLDGARVPHLYPGTKLQLRPAGTPGGVGTEFEDSLLRYISAALGISYEELSHNYSNTNYSSIKAAGVQTRRATMSKKKRTADRFATIGYSLWLEEMLNAKQISAMPRNAPSFYEGINGEAYCGCEWIGSSGGQIDELKETQAAALRMNNNLSTLEIEAARFGLDWRALLRQRAREKKMMQKLDLWDDLQGQTERQNRNMLNSTTGETREKKAEDGDGESDA